MLLYRFRNHQKLSINLLNEYYERYRFYLYALSIFSSLLNSIC